MKLIQQLLEATKEEPFVASDGTKNFGWYAGKQPSMTWQPPKEISIFRRGPRADEDRAASKKVLDQLQKDLVGYKDWVKANPAPYAKEKAQMVKNSERIVEACLLLDSKMDAYNTIIGKANKAAEEKDDAKYGAIMTKLAEEMKSLCRTLSNASKDVNTKMGVPPFISKFRAVAAQRMALMFASRDNMDQVARRALMSPKRREAAQKTSARMKMAWGE